MSENLISQEAIDLIVAEEVSSREHYEKSLRSPEWPGGESGVTIGIGYDVGYCDSAEQLWSDWRGYIPDEMITGLARAIGVTGGRAAALAQKLSWVDVPWENAMAVFLKLDVPRWYATCKKHLPNFEELPPDCKGALVSLTYNRGPSFSSPGPRYQEMRNIKGHMSARRFDLIPQEFRDMKRLWAGRGLDGLLARRDREADMFERGLSGAELAPEPDKGDNHHATLPRRQD